MNIIAERINMSRSEICQKVIARDKDFIINEVVSQEKAGANYIDLNAGAHPERETDDMAWLVETAQAVSQLPFCYDSANATTLKTALSICNRPDTIVNSTTLEEKHLVQVLPLVKEYKTKVIVLLMDEEGLPKTKQRRLAMADKAIKIFSDHQIAPECLLLDILTRPVSTNQDQVLPVCETVKAISEKYPQVGTVVGLSNISFGLPKRQFVNRAFLTMLLANGLTSAIIDPCDKEMMITIWTMAALMGQDDYCINFINKVLAD